MFNISWSCFPCCSFTNARKLIFRFKNHMALKRKKNLYSFFSVKKEAGIRREMYSILVLWSHRVTYLPSLWMISVWSAKLEVWALWSRIQIYAAICTTLDMLHLYNKNFFVLGGWAEDNYLVDITNNSLLVTVVYFFLIITHNLKKFIQ